MPELIKLNNNFFVALQYHTLFLNRRLILFLGDDKITVLKVGNMLADQHPTSNLANIVLKDMQVRDDRLNALNYIQNSYQTKYQNFSKLDEEILSVDNVNFELNYGDILKVRKNTSWKWGMGSVPYTGRIHIKTKSKKYEFIVLGNQDINVIYTSIFNKINAQNTAPPSTG